MPLQHNSIFYTKIDNYGVQRGDTGRILSRWRSPVASKVALDMLPRAMCLALYRLIRVAIKMAHDEGTFVRHRRLFHLTNCSEIT